MNRVKRECCDISRNFERTNVLKRVGDTEEIEDGKLSNVLTGGRLSSGGVDLIGV